jgi:hypothetical protein
MNIIHYYLFSLNISIKIANKKLINHGSGFVKPFQGYIQKSLYTGPVPVVMILS